MPVRPLRLFLGLLFFAAAVVAPTAAGQERYVRFVDEGSVDKSFVEFRTRLIAAAEKRDVKFIISVLDRNIKNSFGGNDGIAEFKNQWNIDSPKSSFWDEFLPVIRNGGQFVRDGAKRTGLFFAPYSFQAFPDDLDAFDHSVIFGADVNLRDEPSERARITDRLSYNVVKIVGNIPSKTNADEAEWYKVETLGSKTGWVKAEFVRSPVDYRAGFEKKRGIWKMTAFIAGD